MNEAALVRFHGSILYDTIRTASRGYLALFSGLGRVEMVARRNNGLDLGCSHHDDALNREAWPRLLNKRCDPRREVCVILVNVFCQAKYLEALLNEYIHETEAHLVRVRDIAHRRCGRNVGNDDVGVVKDGVDFFWRDIGLAIRGNRCQPAEDTALSGINDFA